MTWFCPKLWYPQVQLAVANLQGSAFDRFSEKFSTTCSRLFRKHADLG